VKGEKMRRGEARRSKENVCRALQRTLFGSATRGRSQSADRSRDTVEGTIAQRRAHHATGMGKEGSR